MIILNIKYAFNWKIAESTLKLNSRALNNNYCLTFHLPFGLSISLYI